MTYEEYIRKIHKRIAIVAVGGSALRNQGDSGLVGIARSYFENEIVLDDLFDCLQNKPLFDNFLNKHTKELVNRFPEKGKSWGAARKGLNLFFRDLVYNKFIAEKYKLSVNFQQFNDQIKHLEVPLDSYVANELYGKSQKKLPRWISIKELQHKKSEEYQAFALDYANELDIARVNLDLLFWQPSKV